MANPRYTRVTGIGEQKKKALQTQWAVQKFRDTATVSSAYSDGTAVAELKVGQYTYQGVFIAIRSSAAIAGETVAVDGKHYVTSNSLSKYVENISLEIDGSVERKLSADLHRKFNNLRGYDTVDGMLYMPFGGPFQFDDKRAEDAYALGTSDVRSLRLLFDLTSDWVNGSMFIEVMSEYTSTRRKLEFIRTMKSYRYTIGGAGEFTISDLPVHADLGAIYVIGDSINSADLVVDDVELYDAGNYHMRALNMLYGADTAALGNGITFDFLRTKEVTKGLRGLKEADQRKRNADIRLTLDMSAAGEVQVILDQIGRYATQG